MRKTGWTSIEKQPAGHGAPALPDKRADKPAQAPDDGGDRYGKRDQLHHLPALDPGAVPGVVQVLRPGDQPPVRERHPDRVDHKPVKKLRAEKQHVILPAALPVAVRRVHEYDHDERDQDHPGQDQNIGKRPPLLQFFRRDQAKLDHPVLHGLRIKEDAADRAPLMDKDRHVKRVADPQDQDLNDDFPNHFYTLAPKLVSYL